MFKLLVQSKMSGGGSGGGLASLMGGSDSGGLSSMLKMVSMNLLNGCPSNLLDRLLSSPSRDSSTERQDFN